MQMLRSLFLGLLLCLSATAAHAVPSITVAPGAVAGYIPLDAFGVSPIPIGDEQAINLNVPNFVYAGESWNRIGVTSNGYIMVGGTSGAADISFTNTALPDPTAPKNILAPFWTDLDGTAAPGIFTEILTDGVSDWLVVEWRLNTFGSSTLNVFQAWIGLNGVEDITFNYAALDTSNFVRNNVTVGANDKTGAFGGTYYFNGVGTFPSVDLRVTTTDLPVEVAVPEPATLVLLGAGLVALAGLRRRR